MALAGRSRWPCIRSFMQRVGDARACAPCAPPRRRPGAAPAAPRGSPSATFGSSTRDAVVAGQAELQPATEGGPVDRGARRAPRASPGGAAGACRRAPSRPARARRPCPPALRSLRSPPAKNVFLAEVMTTPVIGVLLRLQALDRGGHRFRVGAVHRVGRLVGVVEGQHDDAVPVLLPADGRALSHDQIASTTVAIPMPPPTHSVASP